MAPVDGSPAAMTTLHVRKAIAGDDGSLEWVVQRLTPLLLVHAQFRLGTYPHSLSEPLDIVNEAWMVTIPRLDQLTAREERFTPVLLKFLTTAITYRVGKFLRSAGRAAVQDGSSNLDDRIAQSTGVFTQVLRGERHDGVHAALQELSASDREILILRGLEQLPSKMVSERLDLTIAAVDQRFSRALKRLRKELPQSVFEEIAEPS